MYRTKRVGSRFLLVGSVAIVGVVCMFEIVFRVLRCRRVCRKFSILFWLHSR